MPKFKPLVSDETLQRVYSRMLEARAFDTRLKSLRRVKHLKTGEGAEAMLAALLDDLRPTDLLIARKVDPLAHLLRGSSATAILGELLSKDTQSSRALYASAENGLATFTGTPAEMATFAAGAARAFQKEELGKKGKQPVTLALLGDVDDVKTLDAALRAAGQGHLPALLVCCTYGSKKLDITRDNVHGVPHMPVDARDALAVYRVAQESLLRIRTGLGGVLVECRFFPGDPLILMEERLTKKGILKPSENKKTLNRFSASLDAAFRASKVQGTH